MFPQWLLASWRDTAGIAASLACAAHCAAMPLLIGYLPASGLGWLAGESFHAWMAAACFGLALAAFVPGWLRHRRRLPGAVGLVGVTLLGVAAFGLAGPCCDHDGPDAPNPPRTAARCCADCRVDATPDALAWPTWGDHVTPWLTPLGGLFLVAGHLANRRYACRCCTPRPMPEA